MKTALICIQALFSRVEPEIMSVPFGNIFTMFPGNKKYEDIPRLIHPLVVNYSGTKATRTIFCNTSTIMGAKRVEPLINIYI